jgi:hypothetical protein
MIDTGTYMILGSVALTMAGFASLLTAFERGESMPRLMAWRIRYIVTGGLMGAIMSFVLVAFASFTDNSDVVVRFGMSMVLLSNPAMGWSWRSLRDPEVFRTATERNGWIAGGVLTAAVVLVNLFLASTALMFAIWVFIVVAPATIFINVMSELYTPPRQEIEKSAGR